MVQPRRTEVSGGAASAWSKTGMRRTAYSVILHSPNYRHDAIIFGPAPSAPSNNMIAVFSRGIARIPHLESLLGAEVCVRPSGPGRVTAVAGWGWKKSADRARAFAARHGLPYLALEDGFLRSFGLGVAGAAPLSIVVDDQGIYYDATRPSRLESWLNGAADLAALLPEARRAMALIREHRLSKYNHAPELPLPQPPSKRPRVLVVDQTLGDMSISLGLADASSFSRMLAAARAENPGAEVYVKLHPDVVAGKKAGHLAEVAADADTVILRDDMNPIALLERMDRVYVVSSQLGFEALLLGKPVTCFGMPFYAGWGVTDDRAVCPRRTATRSVEEIFAAAYLLYPRYLDPETGRPGTIFDVIEHLALQKRFAAENSGTMYCFGFQRWKRRYVRPFLQGPNCRLVFCRSLAQARRRGLTDSDKVVAWGRNEPAEVTAWAEAANVPIWRVEDGFIRSVGLGSDLIRPLSLVVDKRGIYFDPSRPSDLEQLLNHHEFDPELLARARRLRELIVQARLTKYNTELHRRVEVVCSPSAKRILVPGQVEDDASIRLGCTGIRTNEGLLAAVRAANPQAFIIYKPHPDTMAGNRRGAVAPQALLRLCDHVETRASVVSCLDAVDEIHTLTSLTGFDGLLRNKTVVTYGAPFYAGWGLTQDKQEIPRRTRRLTLDELVAGALLLYPRYRAARPDAFVKPEAVVSQIAAYRGAVERLPDKLMERALLPGYWVRQCRKARLLLEGWARG